MQSFTCNAGVYIYIYIWPKVWHICNTIILLHLFGFTLNAATWMDGWLVLLRSEKTALLYSLLTSLTVVIWVILQMWHLYFILIKYKCHICKITLCSTMWNTKTGPNIKLTHKVLTWGKKRKCDLESRQMLYLFISLRGFKPPFSPFFLPSNVTLGNAPLSTLPWWKANTITDISPEGLWIWVVGVRG